MVEVLILLLLLHSLFYHLLADTDGGTYCTAMDKGEQRSPKRTTPHQLDPTLPPADDIATDPMASREAVDMNSQEAAVLDSQETDDAHSKCSTMDSQGTVLMASQETVNMDSQETVLMASQETVNMDSQGQEAKAEGENEGMLVDPKGSGKGEDSQSHTRQQEHLYSREKQPDPNFPSTLKEFGYEFKEGKLVNIETGGPFVFGVREGDREYNQRHYEAIGEVITDVVYNMLETEAGLRRITLPKGYSPNETSSFIFVSDEALSNPDKLMVLIHGSGVVRAGQWSRRLIINDSISSGTQLPFILQAVADGYGVVVLNPNRNRVEVNGKLQDIPGNSTPEKHGCYVWKNIIRTAKAKQIYIVAHSYGGIVTVEMLKENVPDFRGRVKKIAFTDSIHSLQSLNRVAYRWITAHARNWVSSRAPLDTKQTTFRDVQRFSAGTPKHEETSWHAFQSIFAYFNDSTT